MHTTNLRKVGGSVMMAVPSALLESGRLVVEPQQSRYTLDELLAQCDAKAPRTMEEHEWLDSKLIGGEFV